MPGTESTTTEQPAYALSDAKCAFLALQLKRACGVGRILLTGDVPAKLVTELLSSNVDAFVSRDLGGTTGEPLGDQFVESRTLSSEDVDSTWFDDVVVISNTADAETADMKWIASMSARARRSFALVLTAASTSRKQRHDWERAIIPLGFRKHPMLGVVAPYAALDQPAELMILLFEPVPHEVLGTLPVGDAKVPLSMEDETRKTGYGSDALLARYGLAALFVRPGDNVVDVACGLGEGTHMLTAASRAASVLGWAANRRAVDYAIQSFGCGSPGAQIVADEGGSGLGALEPESLDFAVLAGVLEYSDRPELLLAELRRALTPGGRAWVTVPTRELVSEAGGADASRRRGYDWSELVGQLTAAGFYLDRAWMQVEGGANRPGEGGAALVGFPPQSGPVTAGDWLMVLAMTPLEPGERVRAIQEDVPNILAFARDYENPWLVRGLVSMGLRALSGSTLEEIASDTLNSARREQADFGAALCVLCYRELDSNGTLQSRSDLARRAMKYTEVQAQNPTVLRWQVSLAFAAALLYVRMGDGDSALVAWERVTSFDVLEFSPLLGTKTVAAAFSLGEMGLAAGDLPRARQWWLHAVAEARRLMAADRWNEVVGDPEYPQTFGMPELASILLLASKAVNGLRSLREPSGRPGVSWQLIHGTPDELVASKEVERRVTDEWVMALQAGKQWIDEQYWSLLDEISRLNQTNDSLMTANNWAQEQARALEREVLTLQQSNSVLAEAREWLDGQYRSMLDEISRLNESNDSLVTATSLAQERGRALEQELLALQESNSALAEARDWLDVQYHSLTGEVFRLQESNSALAEARDGLGDQVDFLRGQNETLVTAKDWLDIQYHSLTGEVSRLELAGNMAASSYAELDGRFSMLADEHSRLQGVLDEQQKSNAELSAQCQSLQEANEGLRKRLEKTLPRRIRRLLRRLRAALWTKR